MSLGRLNPHKLAQVALALGGVLLATACVQMPS